tara:strand:- start:107 stop:1033 length:927 start_codon:yes stop_codon:yes gene_type:complete
VGNLNVGGTGKTPTVLYLCKVLQSNNINDIAILSRGYKRDTKGTVLVSKGNGPLEKWQNVGDEPFMMAKKTKNIPIVVDNNRSRGGLFLVKNFKTNIIILDDGFQHRSLSRDIDIVLIDGLSYPSEYSFLSISYLRETWSSLKRADVIIFTKNNPTTPLLNRIRNDNIFYCCSIFTSAIAFPKNLGQNTLKDKKVFLLSGIGNPEHFEKTANENEFIIVGKKALRDHFIYNAEILSEIIEFAKSLKADCILTTEKDWVKIRKLNPKFSFAVLKIELKLVGENNLENFLEKHFNLDLSHSPSENNTNES